MIIAAPDSPAEWKAQASVIVDNVNDELDISPNSGETRTLAPGNFYTQGYTLPKAGSKLLGQGPGTVIHLAGFGVLPFDVSNIEVGQFDLVGTSKDFAVAISANQADVANVIIRDINCRVLGCVDFMAYAGSGRKVSKVNFLRNLADSPDAAGFMVTGEGVSPTFEDIAFFRDKARNCGIASTRIVDAAGVAWTNGFDLAEYHGGIYRRISAMACESDYSWEDAFHLEYAPTKQDILLLDNYAAHAGQKPAPMYGCGFLLPLSAAHPDSVAFFGQTGIANTLGDVRIFNEASQQYDTYSLPYDFVLPNMQAVRVTEGNCTGVAYVKANGNVDVHLYSTDGQPVSQFIPSLNRTVTFTDFLNLYDQPVTPIPPTPTPNNGVAVLLILAAILLAGRSR